LLIIGLMSGTSADGIDAALVDVRGSGGRLRASLIEFACVPHEPTIKGAILKLCDPRAGRIPELCALSDVLGRRFGEAAVTVADSAGISLKEVSAIASHGQTVWHQPDARDVGGARGRGTLQIGNPAVIGAVTGCSVISDFRSADMAAGGQGAPLVPFADWALLKSGSEPRAVQNIGGIANVTFLPRGSALAEIAAFDTGPGNMVIDSLARALSGGTLSFDKDGAWASQGTVNVNLLRRLFEHRYFKREPPKSTGREQFGEAYTRRLLYLARNRGIGAEDLMATATAFTAESIGLAYDRWIKPRGGVGTVILGGGGARNRTLCSMLVSRLKPARIATHEEFGIPGDAKEAMAFAILGYETLHGRPSNVPAATGAEHPVVLGNITPRPR
jgi:anhydro-N-acetylmuramic acid kinase